MNHLLQVSILLTTTLVATAAPAQVPDEALRDALASCREAATLPAEEGRVCRSLEQLVLDLGTVCRLGPDPEACAPFYGEAITDAAIDAYETTWTHHALGLQRRLDDALPLRDAFFPATHNSYNSSAYLPTVSGLDMNQHLTLFDQLRMDARGLELDIHWFPSPSGDPEAPILCHGTGPHLGCTIERPVGDAFEEIRAWLDLPESAGEVVVIDLELHLDGETAAHEAVVRALEESGLATRVFGPPDHGGTCADGIPLETSRAEILAAGKRVLLYGGCHPASPAWQTLVHSNGGRSQSGMPAGFEGFPGCGRAGADRALWTRHWEDTTWLSAMAGASTAPIDAEALRKLSDCALNMPSLDKVTPADERMSSFVWSWEVGFPAHDPAGSCAYANAAGRFENGACSVERPFACVDGSGAWSITATSGAWTGGALACPSGAAFAVPRNGYEGRLLAAAAGGSEVWIDYSRAGGIWTPSP